MYGLIAAGCWPIYSDGWEHWQRFTINSEYFNVWLLLLLCYAFKMMKCFTVSLFGKCSTKLETQVTICGDTPVPTYFSMLHKPTCKHWKSKLMRTQGCSHDLWLIAELHSNGESKSSGKFRITSRDHLLTSPSHCVREVVFIYTTPKNQQAKPLNCLQFTELSRWLQSKRLGREY